LCADVCRAADWVGSYAFRQGELRHHPSQTVEDRRARANQRAPHKDCNGVRLSRNRHVEHRGPPSQRSGQSPRLTCLTRGAATRKKTGTTPRPTETIPRLIPVSPERFRKPPRLLTPRCRLSIGNAKNHSAKSFHHAKVG